MVILKTPDASATSKQLWRLHQLTKEDTRGLDLTMQDASDRISKLESGNIRVLPSQSSKSSVREPFTEAHVTIVEGDQRSGKTNTATARVIDAYFKDCVRVYCEEILHIRCDVKSYSRKDRLAKIRYNGNLKLLHIPINYKLHSPMKVFCNYHLYGIPALFCPSFNHILAWLKAGLIVNAWLVVDEAYVGMNARASMHELGKELEKQYFQLGKMQLDVIIVTPMARLIDWTLRTIPTEHIHCEYNKKTRKITLTIRKRGIKGERKLDYDATQYWKYFKTNERIIQ